MEMPVNVFKRALGGGQIQYGLWIGLGDPVGAEICAGAGFDWLLIDAEHAPIETRQVLACLQAMAPYPVAPMVRPLNDDAAGLKRLLDIGVQSFLIPMVDSAEQAAAIVSAVRYPPDGIRGLGTSLARAARWNQIPDYIARANEEICVIVQVETRAGLENIDAIVATEGVDGVFIGPSDLGAALGHPGAPNHPEVVAAVTGALNRIRAGGKPGGVLAVSQDLVRQYVDAGARFVGIGTDTGILAKGAQSLASSFREGVQSDSGGGDY